MFSGYSWFCSQEVVERSHVNLGDWAQVHHMQGIGPGTIALVPFFSFSLNTKIQIQINTKVSTYETISFKEWIEH